MRTLLLFGSKVSPAPDVGELTKAVLEEPMYRDSRGQFIRGTNPLPPFSSEIDYSRLVPRLLKRIQIEFARYQQRKPDGINYEEIASVCWQLMRETQSGLLTNPAVGAFGEQLEREFAAELPASMTTPAAFSQLVSGAVEWTTDVVALKLGSIAHELSALTAFFGRFPPTHTRYAIATLNHDLVLEQVLGAPSLNLGFREETRVQIFNPARLHADEGLRIIKLHGSVDWFESTTAPDVLRGHNPDQRRPHLLIGTVNKPEEYTRSIFPHLFHAFQNELYRCSRLLVSGYGFKDGGVNWRIIDWLHYRKDARMLVIHPNPEALRDQQTIPYSICRALGNGAVVDPNDKPLDLPPGVTFLPVGFEHAACTPWDAWVERFVAA